MHCNYSAAILYCVFSSIYLAVVRTTVRNLDLALTLAFQFHLFCGCCVAFASASASVSASASASASAAENRTTPSRFQTFLVSFLAGASTRNSTRDTLQYKQYCIASKQARPCSLLDLSQLLCSAPRIKRPLKLQLYTVPARLVLLS